MIWAVAVLWAHRLSNTSNTTTLAVLRYIHRDVHYITSVYGSSILRHSSRESLFQVEVVLVRRNFSFA